MSEDLIRIEKKIDELNAKLALENTDYYSVNDLQQRIPDLGITTLRSLMSNLRKKLNEEYPSFYEEIMFLFGTRQMIPRWFYEEKMTHKIKKSTR